VNRLIGRLAFQQVGSIILLTDILGAEHLGFLFD